MPTISGIKFDQEKDRWDLLPFGPLRDVVRVLTFGARKYEVDNWKKIEDARRRYLAAAMRHLVAWEAREQIDADSGLPHLAHAACCLLFLMWFDAEASGSVRK